MKKLVLALLMLFTASVAFSQTWKPTDPNGLIASTDELTIIVSPKHMVVMEVKPSGMSTLDTIEITTYDSLGHFIHKGIYCVPCERTAKIVYEYITKTNGWIKLNNLSLPTLFREEKEKD